MTSAERDTAGKWRRYIMIGAPVTTVRTPPLLEAYLAEKGVAATVETRHVEPDALRDFIRDVYADARIDGLMVTMPHKKPLLPLLFAVSDVADRAGGVNAVKRNAEGLLVGAHFDGIGLTRALQTAGADLGAARILLCGLGGAGLAIAQALAARGCKRLAVFDTDTALRDRIAEALAVEAIASPETGPHDILINATPLGMASGDPSPFPQALVEKARFVADIVADPPKTQLAALAAETGTPLITGRDMVHGQVGPIGDWLVSDDLQQDID